MTLLLTGTAAVVLAVWASVMVTVLTAARARRPELPRPVRHADAGALPEPADPALRRVLETVRRHPGGGRLRNGLLASALEGLLERDLVRVDVRGDGPWAEVADGPASGLAPHEEALYAHLRQAARRAAGPLPLAALRPTKGVDADRAWLAGLVDEAVGWVRRGGYLRDLVAPGVRGSLIALLLVAVELLVAAALVAVGAGQDTSMAVLIFGLFLGYGLGRALTAPLQGYGLTAAADRAFEAPAPGPAASPRPLATAVARLLTTGAGRRRAWSSADETWREVRVRTGGSASAADDPREVRNQHLAVACVLAVIAVVLVRLTAGGSWHGEIGTFFLLTWWGAWLWVAARSGRRLALALSDLRTGPVTWTGQVVQRRTAESESSGPEGSSRTLYVVAVDTGGGDVRSAVVDQALFERLPAGTWVRATVTPRLRHLVSIEPLPGPGGVGLPPTETWRTA